MRALLVALLLLPLVRVHSSHGQQLEFHMISSGPNRPGVPIWMSPMREILAGLHAHLTPDQLATVLGLSRSTLDAKVDSMRADGVVALVNGVLRPSCIVISLDEAAPLIRTAADVARDALPFMRDAARDLRTNYRRVRSLASLSFDDVSFFLMSDVLLDSWQIGEVERRWLKAERPLRGRSRYYCSIFPRAEREREPFGIFGNQMFGASDGRMLGVYGNRRGAGTDLISLPQAKLATLAARPDTLQRSVLISRVLDQLRQLGATPVNNPPSPFATQIEALGLTRTGRPVFAVLDSADNRQLGVFAAAVIEPLLAVLERATPLLRSAWTSSRWHDEISFEEYRIWWYHFFYSALTEQLAQEGVLTIPATGLFHYIVVR